MKAIVTFNLGNGFVYGIGEKLEDIIWQESNIINVSRGTYTFFTKNVEKNVLYKSKIKIKSVNDRIYFNLLEEIKMDNKIYFLPPFIKKHNYKIYFLPPFIKKPNVVETDGYTTVKQFENGLVGDIGYQIDYTGDMAAYGDVIWAVLSILPTEDNYLKVNFDNRGFSGGTIKYQIEDSNKWITKEELEKIDFSNLVGTDVSVIVGAFQNGKHPIIKKTVVHIADKHSNSFLPRFFKRNPKNRLPQFCYNFPKFQFDKKINILQFGQLDENFNYVNDKYLERGYKFIDRKQNENINLKNSIVGNYDEWAYENGCPRKDSDGATRWLESKSIQELIEMVKHSFINPSNGIGALMLNFEAWYRSVENSDDASNKMATIFREFKKYNSNTLLLSYVGSRDFATEVTLSPINKSTMDLENAKYTLPKESVFRQFANKKVNYLNINTGEFDGEKGFLSDYLDVSNCGDYKHFVSHDWIYETIQELELNALHNPNKKALALYWSYVEPVNGSDFDTNGRFFKKDNGLIYSTDYRISAPMSNMYNVAAWGTFLGSGIWIWDNPFSVVEGFNFMGWQGKDPKNANPFPYDFSKNMGCVAISTQIGYDYVTCALYQLWLNKDILESDSKVERVEFSLDGVNFYKDNFLLPASSNFYKIPFVRIKKHPILDEYLVLCFNKNNEHYKNQNVILRMPNNTLKEIELVGQFTKIERLK